MKLSINRALLASALSIVAKEIEIVPKRTFKSLDKVIKQIDTSAKKLASNDPLNIGKYPINLYKCEEVDGNIDFTLNPKAVIDIVSKVSKPSALALYQIGIAGASLIPLVHSIEKTVEELKQTWLSPVDTELQEAVAESDLSPETFESKSATV